MAANRRYYWMRLQEDFFTDKRMKKLRKLPNGAEYTVIFMKLQLLTIKNNGNLEFAGLEDTFEEELALEIDEEPAAIRTVLDFMQQYEMLDISSDSEYTLLYAKENIGSEAASTVRSRESRKNKTSNDDENNESVAMQQNCNTFATTCNKMQQNCNVEIEKEIDIDIDIYKEKDKEKEKTTCKQVVALYHSICISYPSVKSLSDARRKAINARLKKYSLEDFKILFEKAEASAFLKGSNDRNWSANFDWLIKDANIAKVIDGNYDNKPGTKSKVSVPDYDNKNKFNNFNQRDYDYGQMERNLIRKDKEP